MLQLSDPPVAGNVTFFPMRAATDITVVLETTGTPRGSDQILLKQLQGCDLGPKSLQALQ